MPTSPNLDLSTLADNIESEAPGLQLQRPLIALGDGFRSIVVRDASDTVYLIGRTKSAAKGYRYQANLLPQINSYLPVVVPNPRILSGPSERFPVGIISYPSLPDRPIKHSDATAPGWEQLASDTAEFLAALHQIPVSALSDLETRPSLTTQLEFVEARNSTAAVMKTHLTTREFDELERWWDRLLSDHWMQDFSVSLIHQDFWHENLLIDPDSHRLTGVLDWEHARIGDPAIDLVPSGYLGQNFAQEVLASYERSTGGFDDHFTDRLDYLRVLREFGGIRYSISHDDQEELIESITKVRNTGVLSG